jgi:hypothetical protein
MAAYGVGTMFVAGAAVDTKVVEGGFDDVVCFGCGDCHCLVGVVGWCEV